MRKRPSRGKFKPWALVTVLGVGACGTLTAGCATHEHARHDVERAVHDWQRQRETPVERHASGSRVKQATDELPAETPERPVDRYIRAALERNPGIQAAIAAARAQLERIPQVMSLPDPVVRTVIRPEPIQTAAGDMYFTLGVAQTIPLLAKLERAGDVAAAETRMALDRLNRERIQVIADVERAYWHIYRFDRYVEITRDNRLLLEDLERVVDTQYQVGKVQQQDLLRAQTELAKLRDDEHRYHIRRSSAVAALNQLTNHQSEREVPTTDPVEVSTVRGGVESLVALAAVHNPELAALREQVERDRAQVEFSNLGYWPEFTVGFEWNYVDPRAPFIPPLNLMTGQRPPINRASEVGDDNWAVTLQMKIPIWAQRIKAAKREARQRLLATQSELYSTENLIAFRIFDAWSRIEAQEHTLRVLQAELIPQSRQTYEVALTAYQAGETDFLSLIDNWRHWLDFELMRHRETVDLETAFADLQREVGLQLLRRDAEAEEQMGDSNYE